MIAFDSSGGGLTTTLGNLTFSHTCSGTDRILFVGCWGGQSGKTAGITGVTYNGVAMTEILSTVPTGPTVLIQKLFYLVNPSTGTNNVVVTRTGTGIYTWGHSVSYTGASQTGVPDASSVTTNTGTSITGTVTTVADNSWLVGFVTDEGSATLTAGAGTVKRNDQVGWSAIADSNSAKTPAGSDSLVISSSASHAHTFQVASFKPAVASTGFAHSQSIIIS